MSDVDMRILERAVAQGDPEAEVRLLSVRIRVGLVTRERLVVAARLGDETALVLAGNAHAPLEWASSHHDREAALKALPDGAARLLGCDWAESVLPNWTARYPHDARPKRAIDATRAWVACPSPANEIAWSVARSAAWSAAWERMRRDVVRALLTPRDTVGPI